MGHVMEKYGPKGFPMHYFECKFYRYGRRSGLVVQICNNSLRILGVMHKRLIELFFIYEVKDYIDGIIYIN